MIVTASTLLVGDYFKYNGKVHWVVSVENNGMAVRGDEMKDPALGIKRTPLRWVFINGDTKVEKVTVA